MAEAAIESRDEADFSEADGWLARTARVSQVLYWGVHLASLLVLVVGVSTRDLWLLGGTLFVRMFFLTAGYHRYFAHRTFKTGRVFQFVLAFFGASAVQKGPLWWAGNHRIHHRETDRPGDPHSPKEGFWHAHQGWIFAERFGPTPLDTIRDFARYPEIEWLNRWHVVPAILLGALCVAVGGFSGFVWGFCVSTTLLWHFTYAVNSFAHRFGTRRYPTGDLSRNNWWVALLTLGEGWHNNHHYYMASVRQGFRWWEIDVTYYVLRGLARLGVIWDLREPPASVVAGESALPRAA